MDPSIIQESRNPEILQLLRDGNFSEVIARTRFAKRKGLNLRDIFGPKTNANIGFAHRILNSCLSNELNQEKVDRQHPLSFSSESFDELNELYRIVLVLEDSKRSVSHESQLSTALLHYVGKGISFVQEQSNDYPSNSMQGRVWIDGMGLRTIAGNLRAYFKRKADDKNELAALILRAKMSCAIMSHYPALLGPDMIGVAAKYEQLGNTEKARAYYRPVVADFKSLVSDIQNCLDDPEEGFNDMDIPITQSLIDALEGLKRTGDRIDEDLLANAGRVMIRLREMENKPIQ